MYAVGHWAVDRGPWIVVIGLWTIVYRLLSTVHLSCRREEFDPPEYGYSAWSENCAAGN
jgi:hypothetical protein